MNTPLSSTEQARILIFGLLLLPTIVFGVGIIPAIFLLFGLVLAKKHQDFSHITTAVRNFNIYVVLVLMGGGLLLIGAVIHFSIIEGHGVKIDIGAVLLGIFVISAPLMYLAAVKYLFSMPLSHHKEWVVINGIFSSKPKTDTILRTESEVEIIKGDKLKQYSVADELLKWAKLKEDGHISESEFIEARSKLLKRD